MILCVIICDNRLNFFLGYHTAFQERVVSMMMMRENPFDYVIEEKPKKDVKKKGEKRRVGVAK